MPIPRASDLALLWAASSVMLRLASHNGTSPCQRVFAPAVPCAQSGIGISPNRRCSFPRSVLLRNGLRQVLRRASPKDEQNQTCCGVAPRRGAGVNTARRERAPFLTWGDAAAASRLLNQIEHAPDQGGTGGQQSSVKGL